MQVDQGISAYRSKVDAVVPLQAGGGSAIRGGLTPQSPIQTAVLHGSHTYALVSG